MSIFKRFLERVTGKRIQRPTMSAASKRPLDSGELSFFGRWLKRIMYGDVQTYTGGKKLTVIMDSDVDFRTRKVFPDYIERRRQRKLAEEAEKGDRHFGAASHDVYPDD